MFPFFHIKMLKSMSVCLYVVMYKQEQFINLYHHFSWLYIMFQIHKSNVKLIESCMNIWLKVVWVNSSFPFRHAHIYQLDIHIFKLLLTYVTFKYVYKFWAKPFFWFGGVRINLFSLLSLTLLFSLLSLNYNGFLLDKI